MNSKNIIKKLKIAYNVEQDLELANILEIPQSTLSAWKTKNNFDISKIDGKLKEKKIDLNWLYYDDSNLNKELNEIILGLSEDLKKTDTENKEDEKDMRELELENIKLRSERDLLLNLVEKRLQT